MTRITLLASALAATLTLMSGAATATAPIAFPAQTTTLKLTSDAGTCLDVEASIHKSGAKVLRWSCTDKPNQAWRISFANYPAFVVISASHSGKCLDLNASNTAPGTPITQWDCHGGENQRWVPLLYSRGQFGLQAFATPGMCLDVGATRGATASLQPCDGLSPGQVFELGTPNYIELVTGKKPAPKDHFKVVFVGDPGAERTEFIIAAATGVFPGEYIPQDAAPWEVTLTVDGAPATLSLVDTKGAADYDRLRPLAYPGADLFVIVYTVTDKPSLERVKDKWVPELRHHAPRAKIIALGTKVDQRDQRPDLATTLEHCRRVDDVQACYEVSSLDPVRVRQTLSSLVKDARAVYTRPPQKKPVPR